MSIRIFFLFFLKDTDCFYGELEGALNATKEENWIGSKIETKTFYWFEAKNKTHLFYFDNSLEFHKRPFFLLILVRWANDNDWPISANCQLLSTTFDNFYKDSVFFSLLPNEQKRSFYRFTVEIQESVVDGEVELKEEEEETSIVSDFELKKLTSCASLLRTVKFGTISRSRFYQGEDELYALFVETYYVLYKNVDESSTTENLFRTADLVEVGYVLFRTAAEKGKVFLTGSADTIMINFTQNVSGNERNSYNLKDYFLFLPENSVAFEFEESKEQQFDFFINNRMTDKDLGTLLIEKLPQVGTKHYLLVFSSDNVVGVELPIYFFGEKLEISELVFVFKLARIKKFGGLSEARVFFTIFDFYKESNSSWVRYDGTTYAVYLNYKIERGSISFGISNIRMEVSTEYILTEKETTKINEPIKRKTTSDFLGGAIIYNKDTTLTLTDPEYYKIALKRHESSAQEPLEEFNNKRKSNLPYPFITLFFFGSFLVVGSLFYNYRKKIYKKRKFNKNKKAK